MVDLSHFIKIAITLHGSRLAFGGNSFLLTMDGRRKRAAKSMLK
jgi:hypothetical protein